MASPTINFNNASGSDTAASGAGPAVAVTGSAAAHTGGSASTTVNLTNAPDLSGVATDGSHAIWLKTSSGRQFSKITGKGSGTVTVEDSFTIASGSAVDYAIGGKRKTFDNADSRTLFGANGAKALWTISHEDDQTISSGLTWAAGGTNTTGYLTLQSLNSAKIISTLNSVAITYTGNYTKFLDTRWSNTNATKTASTAIAVQGSVIDFVRNNFADGSNRFYDAITINFASSSIVFKDCELSAVHNAIINAGGQLLLVENSYLHDCGDFAINCASAHVILIYCRSYNNSQGLVQVNNATTIYLAHNSMQGGFGQVVFGTNTGVAILVNNAMAGSFFNVQATSPSVMIYEDYNTFSQGGGGNIIGPSGVLQAIGSHSLAVNANFASPSTGDFTPGNTSIFGVGQNGATPGVVQPAAGLNRSRGFNGGFTS